MSSTPTTIFQGDSLRLMIPGYEPSAQRVEYGAKNVEGAYFDGYPQIVKQEASEARYGIQIEKDVMVAMRDGTRIAVDIYRPDVDGERFPAILSWGQWGKDAQEAVGWLADKTQRYYDSPLWDGTMEAGDYTYLVPRGYVHVIPDPRGVGNSEGPPPTLESLHDPRDIHDTIVWIAEQPWCTGKVGMLGPSSYSFSQVRAAEADPPPELVAIHPDELLYLPDHYYFHGIFDTMDYHVIHGRHGNDSTTPGPNRVVGNLPPMMLSLLSEEEMASRLQEALEHPDIKFNTKWYSMLRYPMKSAWFFDILLDSFHPRPVEHHAERIRIPMYVGTPWLTRTYIWGAFYTFEETSTPPEEKKLIVYPPGFTRRPYVEYHDETVRWYDYWLKGIDNGIMEEPPIKMFVIGANKWRFEHEWPLARTEWTRYYLHPEGGLSPAIVEGSPAPDSFTQPAAYLDPTVYCLRYRTQPLDRELEVTGPLALYLEAAIDHDDTNWFVDLADVDPEGNRQWLSSGCLKAKFRALDETKSRPWQPLHPREEPVPVPAGEVVEYAIALMPTANVFAKGHSIELIIRNQDDILSRLGTWGVYHLPFMHTVTHEIHLGNSHLLLPVIPARRTLVQPQDRS
jgi:putative CocE/NonD family hydrolase